MKAYKKNEETKLILSNSFIQLMNEKQLSKISIKDITERCGKNRNTFYYHFEDINGILKWTLEKEIIKIKDNFKSTNIQDSIKYTLDYVENNKHILNCIYDSFGREQLKVFFYSYVNEVVSDVIRVKESQLQISISSSYKNFACMFISEAIGLTLINYFKQPNNYAREEFEQYLSHMIERTTDSIFYDAISEKK